MFRPDPLDIGLSLIAAMLLFDASRLPEVARSIGRAIREFRTGLAGNDTDDKPKTVDADAAFSEYLFRQLSFQCESGGHTATYARDGMGARASAQMSGQPLLPCDLREKPQGKAPRDNP